MISSKTDPRNGRKKEKKSYGKVRIKKTMLKYLSFVRSLYLKQQNNILRYFCSLKFEKSLFSNKFSVLYFADDR